jgi:hypothetical protein
MKNANKFGKRGCFQCCDCGRKTRDAGDNGAAELCPECYERGSLQNDISDNGETPEKLAEVEALKRAAISKGGKFEEAPAPAPAPSPAPVATLGDRVVSRFADATKSYDDAKATFIEQATLNPAHAIEWSESILLAQHKYVCWKYADQHFKNRGRDGLIGVCDHFLDSLLINVGSGRSTSLMANANHDALQQAKREVYESIKSLLEFFPA